MRARPLVVGIEGPCCAGKTTLCRQLKARPSKYAIRYVRDYSDYVGGGDFLPPALPRTVADEVRALWHFIGIEVERTKEAWLAMSGTTDNLILIDRSAQTLLAHCHALSHVTGTNYEAASDVVVDSPVALWPDVIVYLDVGDETIRRRNRGKFSDDNILVNSLFNQGIRRYFERLAGESHPRVVWLDAGLDATLLGTLVADSLARAAEF